MANNNDQKILVLKKQIEDKKAKLTKSQKFSPTTNCSIELDGVRHNLHALTKEQTIYLLVKLNSLMISAKELGVSEMFIISGYSAADWIDDFKAKLDFMNRKEEEQKLKAMEAKLDKMLSDDKKIELELNEMEDLLK